jgi:hypothetical protein
VIGAVGIHHAEKYRERRKNPEPDPVPTWERPMHAFAPYLCRHRSPQNFFARPPRRARAIGVEYTPQAALSAFISGCSGTDMPLPVGVGPGIAHRSLAGFQSRLGGRAIWRRRRRRVDHPFIASRSGLPFRRALLPAQRILLASGWRSFSSRCPARFRHTPGSSSGQASSSRRGWRRRTRGIFCQAWRLSSLLPQPPVRFARRLSSRLSRRRFARVGARDWQAAEQ